MDPELDAPSRRSILRGVSVAPLAVAGVAGPAYGAREPHSRHTSQVPVFLSGTEGYDTFRIPAIVLTRRGRLLAFAEGRRASASDTGNIDIVLKDSVDGGRTWSPARLVWSEGDNTYGNPAPVIDRRTGRVVLLTTRNAGEVTAGEIHRGEVTPEQTRRVFVQLSEDDGRTWSTPRELTDAVKRPDWRWYATGPGHAICLRRGRHAGRLVVPCDHTAAPLEGSGDTGEENKYCGAHVIFSDDGGATWHIGGVDSRPDGWVNANETTAAELPDGRIYFNTRDHHGAAPGARAATYSRTGGASFTSPYVPEPELVAPVVQASVLYLQRGGGRWGTLLFSAPADPGQRRRMSVRVSHDAGVTWELVTEVTSQPSAYSDLVRLRGNEVGLLYETGRDNPYETITFTRLPLGGTS